MKIVIAVHHFPPDFTGGAGCRAYRTAHAMQARGHTVQVICVQRLDTDPSAGLTWEDELFDGIPVRRLSFNLGAAPDPFRWEYDNEWIATHMRRYFTGNYPDVFHLIGGYLISGSVLNVANELNIPSIVSLTDFWFLCRRITMQRSNGDLCVISRPIQQYVLVVSEKRNVAIDGLLRWRLALWHCIGVHKQRKCSKWSHA